MSHMFSGCKNFNKSLDGWNVSNVKHMEGMFSGCKKFNQPLDSWNVSKVENMEGMFSGCTKFNQPLDSWNVLNVKNMSHMFYNCIKFNQSLKWRILDHDHSIKKNLESMFDNTAMSELNKKETMQILTLQESILQQYPEAHTLQNFLKRNDDILFEEMVTKPKSKSTGGKKHKSKSTRRKKHKSKFTRKIKDKKK